MKNESTIITGLSFPSQQTYPETEPTQGYSLVYDYAKREIHISDPHGKHVCYGDTLPDAMGECKGFPFPRPKAVRK